MNKATWSKGRKEDMTTEVVEGELLMAQGGQWLCQICRHECRGYWVLTGVRGRCWRELAMFLICSGIWCM